MFEIIKSPWEKTFLQQLRDAKRDVYLASPFIKSQTASLITQNINEGLISDTLIPSNLPISITVPRIWKLSPFSTINKCRQKNVPNLHAKAIYF